MIPVNRTLRLAKAFAIAVIGVSTMTVSGVCEAQPNDPVVLTFSSDTKILRLELGLVASVERIDDASGFAIRVILEPAGVRLYNRARNVVGQQPVDLYVCKEKVAAIAGLAPPRNDSFLIPGLDSAAKAESLMDTIWYGQDCENFLD